MNENIITIDKYVSDVMKYYDINNIGSNDMYQISFKSV